MYHFHPSSPGLQIPRSAAPRHTSAPAFNSLQRPRHSAHAPSFPHPPNRYCRFYFSPRHPNDHPRLFSASTSFAYSSSLSLITSAVPWPISTPQSTIGVPFLARAMYLGLGTRTPPPRVQRPFYGTPLSLLTTSVGDNHVFSLSLTRSNLSPSPLTSRATGLSPPLPPRPVFPLSPWPAPYRTPPHSTLDRVAWPPFESSVFETLHLCALRVLSLLPQCGTPPSVARLVSPFSSPAPQSIYCWWSSLPIRAFGISRLFHHHDIFPGVYRHIVYSVQSAQPHQLRAYTHFPIDPTTISPLLLLPLHAALFLGASATPSTYLWLCPTHASRARVPPLLHDSSHACLSCHPLYTTDKCKHPTHQLRSQH